MMNAKLYDLWKKGQYDSVGAQVVANLWAIEQAMHDKGSFKIAMPLTGIPDPAKRQHTTLPTSMR